MKKMVFFLLLFVLIVNVSGCSYVKEQFVKKEIEQSLFGKYNEKFRVVSIEKDYYSLPFGIGGEYVAEAVPETNLAVKIKIVFSPDAEIKIKDDYQNTVASKTMTGADQKAIEQIFSGYGVVFKTNCKVYLDEFPKKINTDDNFEVEEAVKTQGKMFYMSYFLVDNESEVDMIKRVFEENLDYFENAGDSVSYSIGFCKINNGIEANGYLEKNEYWNKNNDFLYGFYDIFTCIKTVQELKDSYVNV